MADATIVDALKRTDLFGSLSNRALGKIADGCRRTHHEAGKEVVVEGETGAGFHLVLEGTASVDVHGTSRPPLGPGDYFGEISLVDGGPRSATVVATTPLEAVSMTSWAFSPILESEPEVARALLLRMCERLRAAESA